MNNYRVTTLKYRCVTIQRPAPISDEMEVVAEDLIDVSGSLVAAADKFRKARAKYIGQPNFLVSPNFFGRRFESGPTDI